jgi:hypothetical protein
MGKLYSTIVKYWLFIIVLVFSGLYITKESGLKQVISSDGSGYYAHLPALFLYQDPSFQKTAEVERKLQQIETYQHYLILDKKGNSYNKTFPGIAILQLPFFGIACLISWISQQPLDGYSPIFIACFFIGSMFYVLLSIFFLRKIVEKVIPELRHINLVLVCLLICSPLFFYMIHTPSVSHLYSFFLFTVFYYLILALKEHFTSKKILLLSVVLGLICLVRPTNIIIVLTIPFFLQTKEETGLFFKRLFASKGKAFLRGLLAFLVVFSIVFISWKWQTGSWVQGSYNGEGFYFGKAAVFQSLFSFRIGLFLHTPLVFVAFLLAFYHLYKNSFQYAWWFLYVALNTWIIASWWCWDYESSFGPRPYSEHAFFLLLPLFSLIPKGKKILLPILLLATVFGAIRLLTYMNYGFSDQRFTKDNYHESLRFWKPENEGRWNWTKACTPFGKILEDRILLDIPTLQTLDSSVEFSSTIDFAYPKDRKNKRYYAYVTLEKMLLQEENWENVYLVIDAYKEDQSIRYYRAVPLFADKLEGKNSWSTFVFEEGTDIDCLKKYDFLRIYIWNSGRKSFQIRNVKYWVKVVE